MATCLVPLARCGGQRAARYTEGQAKSWDRGVGARATPNVERCTRLGNGSLRLALPLVVFQTSNQNDEERTKTDQGAAEFPWPCRRRSLAHFFSASYFLVRAFVRECLVEVICRWTPFSLLAVI